MRILPVIDVQAGQVVHGVAGERSNYRPWRSALTPAADPIELAEVLRTRFRATEAYVADLDALTGGKPQWDVLAAIVAAGLRLWLDAATGTAQQVDQLLSFDPDGRRLAALVVGLESLADPAALADVLRIVPAQRVVFSLDLFEGQPWTTSPAWQAQSPAHVAGVAYELGVRRMIVLDVARVGTGRGLGIETLCQDLSRRFPDVQLTAGGGVQTAQDVHRLEAAGCQFALVASALHDGRLGFREILANRW